MTTVELKVSLPDELASQAEAAGILTAEGIERPVRAALDTNTSSRGSGGAANRGRPLNS
jgi:hypothetical protein